MVFLRKMIRALIVGACCLGVAACVSETGVENTSSLSPPARSFFGSAPQKTEDQQPQLGPFVAASLAQASLDHLTASTFFQGAMASDPDSDFVTQHAFYELLLAGNVQEAIQLSEEYVNRHGALNDDLLALVYALGAYQQRNWAEAEARLDLASREGRTSFVVGPLLKAWSIAARKDLDRAHMALSPILSNTRLTSLGEEHYAYMLDYLADYSEADNLYSKLISENRITTIQPVVAYASMLKRQGKLDEAQAFLSEQTVKYTGNNYLLREGHKIMIGLGASHRAADPVGAAGLMLYRLGNELSQGNNIEAAIVYLRLAAFMAPQAADIHILLAKLFDRVGQYDLAAKGFGAVPHSDPAWPSSRLRMIEMLTKSGQSQQAEEVILDGLVQTPNDRNLTVALADMYRIDARHSEAVALYSKVIDTLTSPITSDWWVYFARGLSQELASGWEAAEVDFQKALSLNGDAPELLNHLGYSWIDRGYNITEAKAMIEKAVKARPNNGFITDSLGWVHYLTGEYAQAVLYLERAVRLSPNDVTINAHLGDAYWQVGRRIEARFQWQHALDSNPDVDTRRLLLKKLEAGLPDKDG